MARPETVAELDALDAPGSVSPMVSVLDSLDEPPSLIGRALRAVKPFVAPLETMLAEAPPTIQPPPSQATVRAAPPGTPPPILQVPELPQGQIPEPEEAQRLARQAIGQQTVAERAGITEEPKGAFLRVPELEGRPQPTLGERRAAGELPSRGIVQELTTTTRGVPAAFARSAMGTIEGLLVQAALPETGQLRAARPERDLYYDPTLLDTAIESLGLLSPMTILAFFLGKAPGVVAARQGTQALIKRVGAPAVREGLEKLVQATGGTALAFANYEAVAETLRETGEIRRGEREALEPGRIAGAAGRGAVIGAALGPAAVVGRAPLRKAAEVGILASVPAALEGRAPTVADWLDAGVLVGTLTVAGKLSDATIRAIRKPRAQRTPEEQQEVEAIPPETKEEIAGQAWEADQAARMPIPTGTQPPATVARFQQQAKEAAGIARLPSPEPEMRDVVLERAQEAVKQGERERARQRAEPIVEEAPPEARIAAPEPSGPLPTQRERATERATELSQLRNTFEAAMQRAEEASQAANEAVRRVETLSERPVRPEPLERPAEAEAPPERPPEILPPGRIAEAARPEEAPRPTEAPPPEPLPSRVPEVAPVAPPAPPEPVPATFRAYVESQGRRWPITVRDPDYVRLREEYAALRRPRYEQRGKEVVETATGQVVGTGRNGAEAQLLTNRLNAGRAVQEPVAEMQRPVARPATKERRVRTRLSAEGRELIDRNTVNLDDPDQVMQIVRQFGGIKRGSMERGEAESIAWYFFQKKGMALDEIADAIGKAQNRSAKEVEDKLVRGLQLASGPKGLRKPVVGETERPTPPAEVPISPEEWAGMSRQEREATIALFRQEAERFTEGERVETAQGEGTVFALTQDNERVVVRLDDNGDVVFRREEIGRPPTAGEERIAPPPRTEVTPTGEQTLIPGTPTRAMPPTPLRGEAEQKPTGELPLFGTGAELKQTEFGAGNVLFTRERKEAADARLREKGQRLTAGLDPTLLKDLAEIGGFYVEGGLREFAAWSDRMVREMGERVRPHLQAVWDEIQRQRGEGKDKGLVEVGPSAGAPPAETAPRAEVPAGPPTEPARTPSPPPPQKGEERTGPGAERAKAMAGRLRTLADEAMGLNEQAKQLLPEAETIRETGTLAPEAREPFRETGEKPETFATRFSEKDIAALQAKVVTLSRDYAEIRRLMETAADPFAAHTARTAQDLLASVTAQLNQAAKEFRKVRFAAGRAVKRFDRPIPQDALEALVQAGVMTEWLTHAKPRLPIYTNLLRVLKDISLMKEPREREQALRDFVDAWRLNLFAVTSWSLDLVGNTSEGGMQVAGGIGRDIVHLLRGHATFPSLQGLFRAIRERAVHIGQPVLDRIEEGLGASIGGERIRGGFTGAISGEVPGTFTQRTTAVSKVMDILPGAPLYAKGMFDLGAKRLASTATLWREAIEEADRRGITGVMERREFFKRFLAEPPEEAANRAILQGRKAGFDRPLTDIEERIARSTLVRLVGDVFARWPFQFTRTMAEWLGLDPVFLRRVLSRQASPEEWGEWMAKTATGWTGVYLLSQTLYDRTDFNSMEYVHEDGNRTRLSNRDPIPTGLWLAAVLRGDVERATAALRYASIPAARLLTGEGGLLGGIISTANKAIANADVDSRALRREMTDMVNRAIPGQALLSAVKTVFDPTIREGVGANVPGVSLALPPAIARTTGEPLQPRQRVAGIELPAIGGTPIPGAQRLLDSVERLLSRYGLLVYRGPRQPIAGHPPAEVPDDIMREWLEEFGRRRNRLLSPLGERLERGELAQRNPDAVRKMIQARDGQAAKLATIEINRKYGTRGKLPRRPTIRERRGPEVFEREREEAVGAGR